MTPAPGKPLRSPAQAAASRKNGQRSAGPKTALGRAASSANALRTGLYAEAVAMPWEDPERIREIVAGWMGSFAVSSFAATELARRAAHLAVSVERAEHLRDKILAEVLEQAVAESEANRSLTKARETREAVAGLAALAGDVHAPVLRERAQKLVAPIQMVVQAVLELDLPAGVAYQIAIAAGALGSDEVRDVPAEIFAALASGSRAVLAAIDEAIPALVLGVENERKRQTEMLVVVDDARLRQIDRARARLLREIDGILRAMRSLKELDSCAPSPGTPQVPVVVEFKALGGTPR